MSAPAPPPEALLRNLGIVAHINAGKTTLSERFLFATGKQRFVGAVDEGTATMDWMREEQQRGISITAAVTTVRWKGYQINLIDTPGHLDFAAEVQRCLRVLDGVIVVLDGVRGVESQTEIVWRQAAARHVPRLVFVNKLDRATADFMGSLQSVRARLSARALPIVLPVKDGERLVGLVDVVRGTLMDYGGAEAVLHGEVVHEARTALVEALAEDDESILHDYIAGTAVETARLDKALRKACLAGLVVPVLCGAALESRGVDWLLDAVCRYLPSPLDLQPVASLDAPGASRRPSQAEPFCGLCFKVQDDDGAPLHFVRIYSGRLSAGDRVDSTAGEVAIDRLWRLHAADRDEIASASAGDVVALEGGERLATGDTLFAPGHAMRLEPVRFPDPVLVVSLEPEAEGDLERIEPEAKRLLREDPTLELVRDPNTGAFLLRGMGELHLEVFADRLGKSLRRPVRLSKPAVAMWETIARMAGAAAECRHITPQGELVARVEMALVPRPGLGIAMVEDLVGPVAVGEAQRERMALLEEMGSRLRTGLHQPFPARDLLFQLVTYKATWSCEEAIVLLLEAMRIATRKAVTTAAPFLLEPAVEVSIECPSHALSAVLADLGGRAVDIQHVSAGVDVATVRGRARLATMLGYPTRLRSITKGLGVVGLATVGLVPHDSDPERPTAPRENELRSLDRGEPRR